MLWYWAWLPVLLFFYLYSLGSRKVDDIAVEHDGKDIEKEEMNDKKEEIDDKKEEIDEKDTEVGCKHYAPVDYYHLLWNRVLPAYLFFTWEFSGGKFYLESLSSISRGIMRRVCVCFHMFSIFRLKIRRNWNICKKIHGLTS